MNEATGAATRAAEPMSRGPIPVLELTDLRKTYGSTIALNGAALTLYAGQTSGLIGENGAGKSTLVKILSGLVQPDSGLVAMDGTPIQLTTALEARQAGIATAFQELSFVPDLGVAENLLLATGRTPWLRGRRQRRDYAMQVAEDWGLQGLPLSAKAAQLSLRDRQLLEILGAAARNPRVLILDEPTSSLLPRDVDWLFEVVGRLRKAGTAVLFISHALDEVERFCTRVTVQRNGQEVATYDIGSFDRKAAIEQMIGRSLGLAFPMRLAVPPNSPVLLSVDNLVPSGASNSVSFSVREGEIVGMAGLEGQGQRRILEAVAGATKPASGKVTVAGKEANLTSPGRAMGSKGGGIAFVPPERKTQGLILDMTVRKNTSMPALRWLSRAGVVSDRREDLEVGEVLDRVQVARSRMNDPVRQLSGGNQQKVVFAKAAIADPRVMVMYDPTRGVDVGTKFEFYTLIQEMSQGGRAVLLYSTEIPELVNLCHRILVVYGGRVVEELQGDAISEAGIMAAAIRAEAVTPTAPTESDDEVSKQGTTTTGGPE